MTASKRATRAASVISGLDSDVSTVNVVGGPSMQQMIALFIGRAEIELQRLLETRINDEEWDDQDADVDMAIKLTMTQLRRMKSMGFKCGADFTAEWFIARSAIALSIKAFSRPDSIFGQLLACKLTMFDEAANFMDYAVPHSGSSRVAA